MYIEKQELLSNFISCQLAADMKDIFSIHTEILGALSSTVQYILKQPLAGTCDVRICNKSPRIYDKGVI